MQHYWDIIVNSYTGYWNYLLGEISHLSWHNYFWWLVGLSLFAWTAEILLPWRKDQPRIRQDFWLDGFYMFFNYFLFSLIAYNAVSNVAVDLFNGALASIGITTSSSSTFSPRPSGISTTAT